MKKRNYFLIFYIFIIFWHFFIIEVNANATAFWYPMEHPIFRSIFIFFMFFIGTTFEYGVYRFKFKIVKEERRNLLKSCYKVNFITFPITQILAYIIYVYVEFYFWIYIILVELFVITAEWGLLKIEFENRLKSFQFFGNQERFPSKKILISSIIANSSSFLIGLLSFVPTFSFF